MVIANVPDSEWILAGADGAFATLIKKAMKGQQSFIDNMDQFINEKERSKAYGFAIELVVVGPDGGDFLICFNQGGVQPKPRNLPIRNTVIMDEDTVIRMATFDLSNLVVVCPDGCNLSGLEAFVWMIDHNMQDRLPEFKTITTLAEAMAHQEIKFAGDVPNVDIIEWQHIYHKVVNGYMIPIVKEIMIAGAKRMKETEHAKD